MERRESTIFYSDDEGEEGEVGPKKPDGKYIKIPEAELEKYTTVAVRAKISVEVEQRKRLGAWGKRVLVLDGTTLYAYKTKGDGGSVGGWAIGGADVHVRRNNDAGRDDGRHILVIARPPVYKLVFAFGTVYEQARMIQALSSSGATVTGLDAIMLLKKIKEQEQEKKEEEERQKQIKAQKEAEKEALDKQTKGNEPNNSEQKNESKEDPQVEVEEISESIYNQDKGIANNPLYNSSADLTQEKGNDQPDGALLSIARNAINTDKASATDPAVASQSQSLSNDQDSEDKVNPVPKPPRASISEGSPITDTSVPDTENGDENIAKIQEDSHDQSALSSGTTQEDLSSDVILLKKTPLTDADDITSVDSLSEKEKGEDTLAENKNTDSDEDTEEGEGFYEVNPEGNLSENQETRTESEDLSAKEEGDFENNYVQLISKMKLERGLSIEAEGEPIAEPESPEGVRKVFGSSSAGDDGLIKTTSAENDSGSDRETNKEQESDGNDNDSQDGENDKRTSDFSLASDDIPSDNDEKFEQLYRELSSNVNDKKRKNLQNKDLSDYTAGNKNESNVKGKKETGKVPNGKVVGEGVADESITSELSTAEEESTPRGTPVKRVNSIIKKKGSPGTGKPKRVQFNLDATEIESDSTPLPKTPLPTKETTSPFAPSSPTKKKGGATPTTDAPSSPSKKKGIFSNIFSGSSKKYSTASNTKDDSESKKNSSVKEEAKTGTTAPKAETAIKRDPPTSKIDVGSKKSSATSQANVKRQSTVDLTAPLIISGSVEMGGSISGKVMPRRIEVRDGHVLAFMPKATNPTSRLSLVGLSVTPLIGGIHLNTLSLTRSNRCMMVIKLSSREELMKWINVLSDEVIKLTPENQRTGLILYPSLKKEEPKEENEEDSNDAETNGTTDNHKENNAKITSKTSSNAEKDTKATEVSNANVPAKGNKATQEVNVVENGSAHEDSSDGWLRKKQTPLEEFEMGELGRSKAKIREDTAQVTNGNVKSSMERQSPSIVKAEECFKEDRDSDKPRKINKLNIEEIWREHKEIKPAAQQVESLVNRRNSENKHPPLRRLSGQDQFNARRKSEGQEIAENFWVKNSPKKDYHANCHPPLERLSNRNRILSASETNLPGSGEQRRLSNNSQLHRFGSELTLAQKSKKEFYNNTINESKDAANVLVSSRIMRNQINFNKYYSQHGKVNAAPQTTSILSDKNYKRTSLEPKRIEIVENKKLNTQDVLKISSEKVNTEGDQWYEENEPIHKDTEPSKENLPGITWSVAETREKFELLCSVSGENKSGKLTTKTPISRKKTLKKKRSIEGGSGRRSSPHKSFRRSLHGTNSNGTVSPSPSLDKTTDDSLSSQANSLDNLSESSIKPYKLPPVRDLRKNFEIDEVDGSALPMYKASSMGSLNDISLANINSNHSSVIKEPPSPTKSPLRRTQNVLQGECSPASSPEPEFITSKLINGRPHGNIPEQDKGIVSNSLVCETDSEKDNEVVICWRGPYIAQEAEQAVLSNISNAFLAKRRLLAREVAMARIQEKLSSLEETIWDIQASMAELDKQPLSAGAKSTNNWKTLERSLKAAEEDMTYWTMRLAQMQKEADEAREKLANALVTGLTQYSTGGQPIAQRQRQQLIKRYTKGSLKDNLAEEDEDYEEDEQETEADSFA